VDGKTGRKGRTTDEKVTVFNLKLRRPWLNKKKPKGARPERWSPVRELKKKRGEGRCGVKTALTTYIPRYKTIGGKKRGGEEMKSLSAVN